MVECTLEEDEPRQCPAFDLLNIPDHNLNIPFFLKHTFSPVDTSQSHINPEDRKSTLFFYDNNSNNNQHCLGLNNNQQNLFQTTTQQSFVKTTFLSAQRASLVEIEDVLKLRE